jgi:hypothetical protein
MAPPIKIPYYAEEIEKNSRKCGAAALVMVYHSLGMRDVKQYQVWREIKSRDQFGLWYAKTCALAEDAIRRGLFALVVKLKDDHRFKVLRRCVDQSIHVILNHRLDSTSPLGHFTVLVDVEDDGIVVHDTETGRGPCHRVKLHSLYDLWQPLGQGKDEIKGNVLVAISKSMFNPGICSACSTQIPYSVPCANENCAREIRLEPFVVLGCIYPSCSLRTWDYIVCPRCDSALYLRESPR